MSKSTKRVQVTKLLPCNCTISGDIKAKCSGLPYNTKPLWKARVLAVDGAKYQDRRYGQGLRLHNERMAKGKSVGFTCTICGTRKN
jgi:hypothetical protein